MSQDVYRAAVEAEIVDRGTMEGVKWADVAGLEKPKRALQEMVILPALRADLFTGLRAPVRGVLLFGPPGTGKTLLAKAVATEARCTFFTISAATVTSKWMGEGEKLIRALFEVARDRQPAIIFIDEMDSLLSARSASEHEASRRIKTEFLLRFDGVDSGGDRIFVIGATNRPQELDEAVRRRMQKRVYVPLPDAPSRHALLAHLMAQTEHDLRPRDFAEVVQSTEGYSGSDMRALAREAAMEPIRELGPKLKTVDASRVRRMGVGDMRRALQAVRPTVARRELAAYEAWDREFGSK
uniref:microtubule-severing ATPase n=1 Tax=Pyramimonas obovata TaxID=1411642 RepID=A0A7S0S091_9CHLO|mmetsp:Transcript_9771/g.20326  ORF Transcript_9771/g.20326 Transcript_9771/m.20326 type:complete len:297 (+) Transcript_9771:958-1848(+)